MAFVNIQRGNVSFGASSDTTTDTIDAVVLANAFVRITSTHFASAGPTAGTTSNRNNDDLGVTVALTDTTTVTFTRESGGDNEDVTVDYEVWEYVGAASGENEFIVRSQQDITLSNGTGTVDTDIAGITTLGNCVPFICGIRNDGTARNWDDVNVSAEMRNDGVNDEVRLIRGGTSGDTVVSVAIVEFTGSNWSVQNNVSHTFTAAGADETEAITDVTDWDTAFIVSSKQNVAGATGNDEVGYNCWPGATTTAVRFRLRSGHATPGGNIVIAHVVQNDNMTVEHIGSATGLDARSDHQAGSNGLTTYNESITAVSLAQAAAISTSDSTGTGNGYPIAKFNYRLSTTTNLLYTQPRGNTTISATWAAQIISFPEELASTSAIIGAYLLAETGGSGLASIGGYMDSRGIIVPLAQLGAYMLGASEIGQSAIMGGISKGDGFETGNVFIGGFLDAIPKTTVPTAFIGGAVSGLFQQDAIIGGFSYGEPISEEFTETQARVLIKANNENTVDQLLEVDAKIIFKEVENKDFNAKFIISDTKNKEFNAKVDVQRFKNPPNVQILSVATSGTGLCPSGLVTVVASGSLGDGSVWTNAQIDFGDPLAQSASISGFTTNPPWTATHCYANSGIYTITARGQDDQGMIGMDSSGVSLIPPGLVPGVDYPAFAISGIPRSGNVPPSLQVDFTLSTSGAFGVDSPSDPDLYWTFGNRERSQLKNPTTFYSSPGLYIPRATFKFVNASGQTIWVSDTLRLGFLF